MNRCGEPWSLTTFIVGWCKLLIARRLWGLDVGRGTRVHPLALLDRTWPRGLHIGEDCQIAANVAILTHDFTRGLLTETFIGDRCVLSENCIVMPGVRIGEDCLILPGTLVSRSLAAGSRAGGNPLMIELPGRGR